jgi:drug/metabolite transporter (DMT)-like permease
MEARTTVPVENVSERRQHRPALAILFRCCAIALFTIMWASSKLSAENGANTIEIVFFRAIFALPVVLLWIGFGPGIDSIKTKRPLAHVQRSGIGMVSMFFTFYAIVLLPLAEATTIGFTAPIFSTILSMVLLRERIGRYRWAAIMVGFLGVIIVMQSGFSGHHVPLKGLVVGLISAMGIAMVTVTVRQISSTETATATVFWFTVGTAVVAGALMPFFGQSHGWNTYLFFAVTGGFGAVAQLLMTASLRFGPVALVVPFDYTQLVWASLLGWLLWSAVPLPSTLMGSVLIVGAGLFTLYREHRLRIDRETTPSAVS